MQKIKMLKTCLTKTYPGDHHKLFSSGFLARTQTHLYIDIVNYSVTVCQQSTLPISGA